MGVLAACWADLVCEPDRAARQENMNPLMKRVILRR